MCDLFSHCSTNDKLTPLRRIEKAMKNAMAGAKASDAETSTQEPLASSNDMGNMANTDDALDTAPSETPAEG
jgi:hypothetical protein